MARIFVDTNVLFPFSVMDLMLALTEDAVHEVIWTDALLAEWERVIVEQQRRSAESAARVTAAIRSYFAESQILEGSYVDLIDNMPSKDPDDRRHIAAAVAGNAQSSSHGIAAIFPPNRWQGWAYESPIRTSTSTRCLSSCRSRSSRPWSAWPARSGDRREPLSTWLRVWQRLEYRRLLANSDRCSTPSMRTTTVWTTATKGPRLASTACAGESCMCNVDSAAATLWPAAIGAIVAACVGLIRCGAPPPSSPFRTVRIG